MEPNNFQKFIDIIKKLRAPDGCPWDKEQTFESLTPHIIEEAYELKEAMVGDSPDLLKEELGDVLLHVVMLANMAEEQKWFNISDVIEIVTEKMIRRHPHVFGDTKVNSVDDVWTNWEQIKSQEKSNVGKSILNSVPISLPALMEANKLQKKAARQGFDWDKIEDAMAKLDEEIQEMKEHINTPNSEKLKDEAGDTLFALVNVFRKLGIDPEEALKNTNKKFKKRFQHIESEAEKDGKKLTEMSLEEMDTHWEAAKQIN